MFGARGKIGLKLTTLSIVGFLCLVAQGGASGSVVSWTKELLGDVSYRSEVRLGLPMDVHVVRFRYPASGVRLETKLAGGTVLAANNVTTRARVSQMARERGAFLAVNADYFAPSGDPLGLFIQDGQLISEPFRTRSAFGWSETNTFIDRPTWTASLEAPNGVKLPIHAVNRVAGANEIVLFSEIGSTAVASANAMMFVFETSASPIPDGTATAVFKHVTPDVRSMPVKKGQWIVAATGSFQLRLLAGIQQNTAYQFKFNLSGSADWAKARFAVGGGPRLIRNGRVSVEYLEESFDNNFALKRHPRTAIGIADNGDVVIVVIDGRSRFSTGATLNELAWIMRGLGCVEALNLDGGGSSTLYVGGAILNRPSDGQERPVANALLLFVPPSSVSTLGLRISAPAAEVFEGESIPLKALAPDGSEVAPNSVVWVAESPNVRVTQDGVLLAIKEGKARVRAINQGTSTFAEVTVVAKKPSQ